MIIFNNLGHTFKAGSDDSLPIVWVDSSDNESYLLSGNDVLLLFNKGTLGGSMTLNGSVKFANGGFESWSASDYITRDLGEAFLPTNSFTVATTFDCQDLSSGDNPSLQWFSSLYGDANNRSEVFRNFVFQSSTKSSGSIYTAGNESNALGLRTMITSYDLSTNTITFVKTDGTNLALNSVVFSNTVNSIIELLQYPAGGVNSGADNPLHEFRLYERAMSLPEMQNLQTELNNKYSKPIVWVDSSDASTYSLSGNDVTTLFNKGTLGGAMTLNGNVKFANNGFESWSSGNYINYILSETILATNSFTMATTFDLQIIASRNWFSGMGTNGSNRFEMLKDNDNTMNNFVNSGGSSNALKLPYNTGVQTLVASYDLSTNTLILIVYNDNQTFNNVSFSTLGFLQVRLLRGFSGSVMSGADNPLHEFRLYERAMSLPEMKNLQTELNNKYTP